MAIKLKKGYTLIEVMLTVAIIGIVGGMAFPIMRQMTNFWRQTTARNDIQRDVRVALDTINRFARQAQGDTVIIDNASGQPPASRLQFSVINQSGQTVTMLFYQKGNRLYMSNNGNISVLSYNLSYIAFTYPRTDDTTLISVAITTQSPTYMGGKKALQLSIQKVRIMN
ncbi:MAG: type II secretion system protein [Elusimicrobia bacterium]|nr:type II secretion system protein [Elusimicrobiota bacterium]